MAILNNNPLVGASGNQGGYNINNSLRFRSSASAYLNRTPASAGNRKTWTWSAWVKRGAFAGYQNLFAGGSTASDTGTTAIFFNPNNGLTVGGSTTNWLITTQVFRDPSAWYHVVIAMDTTNATANNRLRIYINGSEVTAFSTRNNLTLNTDYGVNQASLHRIGFESASIGTSYFDGYMADVNFIDGSAKTPSDFGETDTTTGVWKPKAYSGTYGTNGFYLKFSDIATTSGSNAGLGKDFSGNSNYWTTNNISVTSGVTYDAMTDSPTNTSATVANYCTLNPLTFAGTVSEANLRAASAGTDYKILGTLGVSSGKWYWEFIANNAPGGDVYGVANLLTPTSPTDTTSLSVAGTFARINTGTQWYENGTLLSKSISTLSAGGIIQFALDLDNLKIWVGINGTWQASGDPAAGTNPISSNLTSGQTWFPYLQFRSATSNISANFGQRPFAYTPPTGFVALNTYNLPDSTIKKGNKYMDATLYTGNAPSTNTINNAAGFSPDLVWIKSRSAVTNHLLVDAVRGDTKVLYSNLTNAEDTNVVYPSLTSTGFTVGDTTWGNQNGATLVAWQWDAGSSTVTNTSGSISSQVRANTTAGFSVVTWANTSTNATIGHGLGVAPKMIIAKNRTGTADSWLVYHSALGATKFLRLESTAAEATNIVVWNNTAPTSTVFSIGTGLVTGNFVAYCWADVSGYSKAFSYTGNGSSDGPMVYLGLKPKFVMLKRTDTTGNWIIYDSSRNTYNVVNLRLLPNTSDAEATVTTLDFLSNGFKLRTSDVDRNANGGTYIGIAFAENPFKNSNAR